MEIRRLVTRLIVLLHQQLADVTPYDTHVRVGGETRHYRGHSYVLGNQYIVVAEEGTDEEE
jgi:hypothetical protein